MAFERIGILSIGEMGYHWAKILTGRGVEVLTYAKDRSETTRKRAENVGVKCVPSTAALVKDTDLIVSIVVPSAAKRVATKVAKAAAKSGREESSLFGRQRDFSHDRGCDRKGLATKRS